MPVCKFFYFSHVRDLAFIRISGDLFLQGILVLEENGSVSKITF